LELFEAVGAHVFPGFKHEDKLPVPELAVPVSVPQHMEMLGLAPDATPKEQTVGGFGLIAFFYLPRVGGYTQKRKHSSTRTIQFCFKDIAFKKGDNIIARDASDEELMKATGVILMLSNQQNRIRGTMIHRCPMGGEYYPIKAIVRRFVHLRKHNATPDTIISTYWDHLGKSTVTDGEILKSVRHSVIKLNLAKNGITDDRVGTHSLGAGGTMALKFAGADGPDIKKLGDGRVILSSTIYMIRYRNTLRGGLQKLQSTVIFQPRRCICTRLSTQQIQRER